MVIVRLPKLDFRPNPAQTDKVIFSADSTSLRPPYYISGGYQTDILWQSEKFNVESKMAAAFHRNINF